MVWQRGVARAESLVEIPHHLCKVDRDNLEGRDEKRWDILRHRSVKIDVVIERISDFESALPVNCPRNRRIFRVPNEENARLITLHAIDEKRRDVKMAGEANGPICQTESRNRESVCRARVTTKPNLEVSVKAVAFVSSQADPAIERRIPPEQKTA